MYDQATVTPRGPSRPRANGVSGGVASFFHDVTELVELQAQLGAVDARDATRRAILPIVLLATAAVLALGTIPVLLAAAAFGLAAWTGLAMGWCLLIVSGVALLLVGAAALIGALQLSKAFQPFTRSTAELQRNVQWLKFILKRQRV